MFIKIQYKITLILLSFLLIFSSCNIKSGYDYESHHIKYHQKHIELIVSMTSFINQSFATTKKFLKMQEGDDNIKKESIMNQWRVTISFIDKLNSMTSVYRDNYINNNLTTNSIIDVTKANVSLKTIILPIETEFKVEVRKGEYEKAFKRISLIETKIHKELKALLKATKNYQKQITK